MTRWVVFCCAGIVALDFAESAISHGTGMPLLWFVPVQVAVYFALGFAARRRWALLSNALGIVGLTALTEATASVAVAVINVPGWPRDVPGTASAVTFAVAVDFVVGAAGVAFASIGRARAVR